VSEEHEIEPVPGLPGLLPEGEHIIWQGAPVRSRLARTALHTRTVALYFAALVIFGLAIQAWTGALMTLAAGLTVLALLEAFAWASARSTIYTLTNRRVVIRAGVALPTCINVPLSLIESADLRTHDDGTGDIPMKLKRGNELGYAQLWPHARPLHINHAQPMLRSIPEAGRVAALLARASGARMAEVEPTTEPLAVAA
jgi:Bacterial PH domain